MNIPLIYSMIRYELRMLLRNKWLFNMIVLFLVLSGLLYAYGIQSVRSDPVDVQYGLDSVNQNIDTSGVNPEYFGLKKTVVDTRSTAEIETSSYTRAIAMLMNLSLWLLPAICLILGTNSILADKESGRFALYKTYDAPYVYYMLSKFLALVCSLTIALGLSYGVFGLVLAASGHWRGTSIFQTFLLLNVLLIVVFSALSLLIGAMSVTRMQGLSLTLLTWSFLVFIYEFVIFSVIDFIPYSLKLKSLLFFLLLNPVETLRVWAIEQLNANYIFGPEYLVLKTFTKTGTLNIAAMTALFAMAVVAILLSTHLLKRREG